VGLFIYHGPKDFDVEKVAEVPAMFSYFEEDDERRERTSILQKIPQKRKPLRCPSEYNLTILKAGREKSRAHRWEQGEKVQHTAKKVSGISMLM